MTISLRGIINGAGDNEALFLKMFHETISAFYIKSEVWDFIDKKTSVKGQKTAQFIKTGRLTDADVETHALGADYTGVDLLQNEITISLDARPIVIGVQYDDQDNYLAQYDKVEAIKTQVSNGFGLSMDKRAYTKIGVATESANKVNGLEGGMKIVNPNFGITVDDTIDVLDTIIAEAQNRGFSATDLRFSLSPIKFAKVRNLLKDYIGSKDYADNAIGFDKGTTRIYYGDLEIISAPHLGKILGTNVTNVNGNTDYAYDFTNTTALCYSKSTVGALVAQDVTVSVTDLSGKNGLIYNAWKMVTGIDVVTPEMAFQVAVA